MAGHPNPCTDQLVRETMKGIRRMLGVAPRQKKGVSTADVRAAVAPLGSSLLDTRDRLIPAAGCCWASPGPGGAPSRWASTSTRDCWSTWGGPKTDQEGRGRRVAGRLRLRRRHRTLNHAVIVDPPAVAAVAGAVAGEREGCHSSSTRARNDLVTRSRSRTMKWAMDSPGVVVCHGNEVYRLGLVTTMENANYTVCLASPPLPPSRDALGGGSWVLLVELEHLDALVDPRWAAVVAIVPMYGRTNVTQAIALGATAVVASTASSATVVTTVAAAFEGNALVPETVLADLTAAAEPTPCALTDEEIGYLQRLAQGMTVCDLARAVGRSERDMYRALSRLWKRMRAIDRTDGLLKAARNGWLDRYPGAVGVG